ncbi:Uncharacterized protein TCM_015904 [Theobroma cacao]|uniref:Uncharacterized protein n=1 Tax=Theobroma cacao TaxID=3641 RepID=A0A061G331_THECC|nr:Uncharacterized protein TCM_015904 [Theobroma cacao]
MSSSEKLMLTKGIDLLLSNGGAQVLNMYACNIVSPQSILSKYNIWPTQSLHSKIFWISAMLCILSGHVLHEDYSKQLLRPSKMIGFTCKEIRTKMIGFNCKEIRIGFNCKEIRIGFNCKELRTKMIGFNCKEIRTDPQFPN